MTNAPKTNDPIPKITRDDEVAGSGDLVRENVERLKALFPQIVTDGKVDFEVLRQLLGNEVEEDEERYGLNWKGKRRARAFAMTPSLGTLRPAAEESVDWDTTQNIMIEGDNLEVLKLLRRSYAGKVKLIYIDPPYNTGSDFVYPDNFQDSLGHYLRLTAQRGEEGETLTSNSEDGGRYHTNWLSMMLPRLALAKELLHGDDGIIAISCDENELHNILAVLEEQFGKSGIYGIFSVITPNQTEESSRLKNIDYLILAGPNSDGDFANLPRQDQSARCTTGKESQTQPVLTFPAGIEVRGLADGQYADTRKTGGNEDIEVVEGVIEIANGRLKNDLKLKARWSNPNDIRAYVKRMVEGGDEKLYNKFGKELTNLWLSGPRLQPQMDKIGYVLPNGVWDKFTKKGSSQLAKLDLEGAFSYPKHTSLISQIVQNYSQLGDIVMDFFAGSGTTGHAVLAQNAKDGASRRYVLVQLPEPLDPSVKEQKAAAILCDKLEKPRNIAELTKERLRRAGKKVREEHPEADIDTGFRVYKLATSNLKPWQPDPDDLEASILDAVDNVLPGRSEEDLLVELLLKTGIDLTTPEEKRDIGGQTLHALGGGALMVCLGNIADDQAEELGQGMADWVDELDPTQTTVYFKDSGIGSDGNRAATKANLAAILRQRLGDRIAKIASI